MLGIVSDSDFDFEIDRMNEKNIPVSIENLNRGRGVGNNAIPDSLKKIISETAIEEGNDSAKEITRAFGISDSSLSAYKNGASSTTSYNDPKPELRKHNSEVKNRIVGKTHSRLLQAIKSITPEKLEAAKARDLAGIARDLSGVIKNLEPEEKEEKNDKPFVIFAPQFRDERSFQTITVKE